MMSERGLALAHRNIQVMPMREKKPKIKSTVKVNFIPVEGNVLETVINALEPNISLVLAKHGASIKIGVKEVLRNHAKRCDV